MIKKRYIILALGVVSVLLASALVNNVILAQSGGEYDPWLDLNDDGVIDVDDLQLLALTYASSGEAINKTALLLELQARIDSLNTTLLTEYYNITECNVLFVDASGDIITGFLDVDDGTLYVDDVYHRVGVGTKPSTTLDVDGIIKGTTLKGKELRLGSTEGDHVIFFYEGGQERGEYIGWEDGKHRFYVSDDMYISASLSLSGTISIPTTTRYYSMPGAAWLPTTNVADTRFERHGHEAYSPGFEWADWWAPINLPHGAVVTELRVWLYDNDADDIDVSLERHQADSITEMASVSSSGTSTSWEQYYDSSISYATVDNQNYAYYLHGYLNGEYWSVPPRYRLGQVVITYTITSPLP